MPVDRRLLLAALLAVPLRRAAGAPPSSRIRGTIAKVVGSYVTVRTRAGGSVTVAVPADVPISVVRPASLAAIQPGSYIGTTAMPQADGTLRALEVHVFPDDLRGLGEGFHSWDLRPGSTMTNGTVGQVEGSAGRRLTVRYRGGEKVVEVPSDAPIVTYAPGGPALLVPGAQVIIAAGPSTGGFPAAKRIVVGADGMTPPM